MTEQGSDGAVQRAEKRVKKVRDFYGNLLAYLIVNTILVLIDLADGAGDDAFLGLDWAYFPIIGWGIFVVLDAISTFGFGSRFFGAAWEERKLREYTEEERRRERANP